MPSGDEHQFHSWDGTEIFYRACQSGQPPEAGERLVDAEPELDYLFGGLTAGRRLQCRVEVRGSRWIDWPSVLVESVPTLGENTLNPWGLLHRLEECLVVQRLLPEVHSHGRPLLDLFDSLAVGLQIIYFSTIKTYRHLS